MWLVGYLFPYLITLYDAWILFQNFSGWYPLYHSLYDTFELVDELYDRGFHFHEAVTKIWANMAVNLAHSPVSDNLDQHARQPRPLTGEW